MLPSLFLFPILYAVINTLPYATASSTENKKNNKLGSIGSIGSKPDLFVTAAPMVVGAVCRDGVALVAAHTLSTEEPLLYSIHTDRQPSDYFLDLPKDFAGPFRIRSVDGYGTAFVACGWRADGDFLWEKVKSIASAEVRQLGPPSMTHYRKFLSSQLSLCMASCALSDVMRPLSSACLMAFPVLDAKIPSLWLVDPTGAYPVRAICLGGGMDSGSGEPLAKIVQARLRKNDIDFASMAVEQGLIEILKLLQEENALQKGSRLEAAVVKENRGTHMRKTIASLLLDSQ